MLYFNICWYIIQEGTKIRQGETKPNKTLRSVSVGWVVKINDFKAKPNHWDH